MAQLEYRVFRHAVALFDTVEHTSAVPGRFVYKMHQVEGKKWFVHPAHFETDTEEGIGAMLKAFDDATALPILDFVTGEPI